jgi:hypothetical protein
MHQILEMSRVADVINTLIVVQDNRGIDNNSDTFLWSNALAKKKMKLSVPDMKRLTGHKMMTIVCNVLAPFSIKQFEEESLAVPYVGIANEKYDRSIAAVVQYFDYHQGGVVVKLVQLPNHVLFGSTPESVSNNWKTILSKNGLDTKVVSYTAEPRFFEVEPVDSAGSNNVGVSNTSLIFQSHLKIFTFFFWSLRHLLKETAMCSIYLKKTFSKET